MKKRTCILKVLLFFILVSAVFGKTHADQLEPDPSAAFEIISEYPANSSPYRDLFLVPEDRTNRKQKDTLLPLARSQADAAIVFNKKNIDTRKNYLSDLPFYFTKFTVQALISINHYQKKQPKLLFLISRRKNGVYFVRSPCFPLFS